MTTIQYCETHDRECKPSECPDVRLYHAIQRGRHQHTCASCGNSFTGRADAKFCSGACRERARRVRVAA